MDSDSDLSFCYDDEDLYISDDEPAESKGPELDALRLSTDLIPIQKSPNGLSNFLYRSLRIEWYIDDHFVAKARQLQLSVLLNFTIDELLVMLQYKKWLVDEVTGDYYNDWPKLRDACGLTDTRGEVHDIVETKNFACGICIEQGDMETFLLSCGHRYCADCYAMYAMANVAKGTLITCMDTECTLSLLPGDVDKLIQYHADKEAAKPPASDKLDLVDGDTNDMEEDISEPEEWDMNSSDEYDRQFDKLDLSNRNNTHENDDPILHSKSLIYAARVSIDTLHQRYRWCPALDCSDLAELVKDPRDSTYNRNTDYNLQNVPIVTCPNSHEFCFDCQYENHLPCPCWLVQKWVRKCEDDSETANWIDANTHSCPKCHSQIEKNGGCNHMTCRKCKYEFCWICFGNWEEHKTSYWQCNRYNAKEVEEVTKKRSEKQQTLNRYLHFYKRFSVHQRSMMGDEETLASVHRCMLVYMKAQRSSAESVVSWNDVQFLSDAIRSLTAGRKTLMWTYAFAFYLKSTNLSEIFERLQDMLSKTVEDLSLLFEDISNTQNNDEAARKITRTKSNIINLAALVTRHQQKLIECAHSELELGNLVFADI